MKRAAMERRLRWQCRRGLLELDLLFGRFLERGYHALTEPDRQAFRMLLREPDARVLAWFQGQDSIPDEFKDILHKITQ
jgi:antitoxin CptB